jgi:hypothetical protein
MKTKTHFAFPRRRLGSFVRPCHLDRYAFRRARPEVACRYRTGRVALREIARLKIVPQVREQGKRPLARQGAALARWPMARITLRQGIRVVHEHWPTQPAASRPLACL